MTVVDERAVAPASSVTHPADYLLDTPLADLLADLDVQLVDSSLTDATFFGVFLERRDGSRILAMPSGRSAFERDTAARMLLADGLGL